MRGVLGLRVDARHYVHVLRRILRRFFKVVVSPPCDHQSRACRKPSLRYTTNSPCGIEPRLSLVGNRHLDTLLSPTAPHSSFNHHSSETSRCIRIKNDHPLPGFFSALSPCAFCCRTLSFQQRKPRNWLATGRLISSLVCRRG